MSRYRKPVFIPRPDEEPDFEQQPQRGWNELDWVIQYCLNEERKSVGGYHDARRNGKVA